MTANSPTFGLHTSLERNPYTYPNTYGTVGGGYVYVLSIGFEEQPVPVSFNSGLAFNRTCCSLITRVHIHPDISRSFPRVQERLTAIASGIESELVSAIGPLTARPPDTPWQIAQTERVATVLDDQNLLKLQEKVVELTRTTLRAQTGSEEEKVLREYSVVMLLSRWGSDQDWPRRWCDIWAPLLSQDGQQPMDSARIAFYLFPLGVGWQDEPEEAWYKQEVSREWRHRSQSRRRLGEMPKQLDPGIWVRLRRLEGILRKRAQDGASVSTNLGVDAGAEDLTVDPVTAPGIVTTTDGVPVAHGVTTADAATAENGFHPNTGGTRDIGVITVSRVMRDTGVNTETKVTRDAGVNTDTVGITVGQHPEDTRPRSTTDSGVTPIGAPTIGEVCTGAGLLLASYLWSSMSGRS